MIHWNSAGMSILSDAERQLLEFHHKADAWPMTMQHGTVSVVYVEGTTGPEGVTGAWFNLWLDHKVDRRKCLLGTIDTDDN